MLLVFECRKNMVIIKLQCSPLTVIACSMLFSKRNGPMTPLARNPYQTLTVLGWVGWFWISCRLIPSSIRQFCLLTYQFFGMSGLISPRGRQLYHTIIANKLDFASCGTETYWPTNFNKSPDLIDFAIVKNIGSNECTVSSSYDLSSDHSPTILKTIS